MVMCEELRTERVEMSVGNYCSCQGYTKLRFKLGEGMGRQLHLYSDKEYVCMYYYYYYYYYYLTCL